MRIRRHIGVSGVTHAVETGDGLSVWQALDLELPTNGEPTRDGWGAEQ